jgi:hypothetical protein
VVAPAGTPGGTGGLLLEEPLFEEPVPDDEPEDEEELLDDELDDEPLEDELDDEPLDDEDDDDPEPDDDGSAGCAGVTTGVCGWEAAMVDDGFAPQAAKPIKRKNITTTNPEFV